MKRGEGAEFPSLRRALGSHQARLSVRRSMPPAWIACRAPPRRANPSPATRLAGFLSGVSETMDQFAMALASRSCTPGELVVDAALAQWAAAGTSCAFRLAAQLRGPGACSAARGKVWQLVVPAAFRLMRLACESLMFLPLQGGQRCHSLLLLRGRDGARRAVGASRPCQRHYHHYMPYQGWVCCALLPCALDQGVRTTPPGLLCARACADGPCGPCLLPPPLGAPVLRARQEPLYFHWALLSSFPSCPSAWSQGTWTKHIPARSLLTWHTPACLQTTAGQWPPSPSGSTCAQRCCW